MVEEATQDEVKAMVVRLLDVARTPDNGELCLQGAQLAHHSGLVEEYLLCCERAVNLRPEWIDGWLEFASALFFVGRMRDSIAAAARAAEIKRSELALNRSSRAEHGVTP